MTTTTTTMLDADSITIIQISVWLTCLIWILAVLQLSWEVWNGTDRSRFFRSIKMTLGIRAAETRERGRVKWSKICVRIRVRGQNVLWVVENWCRNYEEKKHMFIGVKPQVQTNTQNTQIHFISVPIRRTGRMRGATKHNRGTWAHHTYEWGAIHCNHDHQRA